MLQLNFSAISEKLPSSKWQKLFNTHWPAYKAWFISKGALEKVDLATAQKQLEKFMPEYMPTYKRLCELSGDDPVAARFLTGYQPPAYISGCSQAICTSPPQLVRNYDYHPHLSEGTLIKTTWNGKDVMGVGDCLSGLVDGMNESGLVVSLTFGGRKVVGNGFGIPFIIRYVLEFCETVDEGVSAFKRIPSHMAYNIMLLDKTGAYKMLQIAPDHPPKVTDYKVSTNHQGDIDWPEHAQFSKTVEREAFLNQTIAQSEQNAKGIADAFLAPPLFNRQYNDGFGTVFTSVYRPAEGRMELRWPEQTMEQSFTDFKEEIRLITYTEKAAEFAPAYEPSAYTADSYTTSQQADYWIEYGKAWASGKPSELVNQVAKAIGDAMGIANMEAMKNITEVLNSETKKRGQVPWELLADLWSNLGNGNKRG